MSCGRAALRDGVIERSVTAMFVVIDRYSWRIRGRKARLRHSANPLRQVERQESRGTLGGFRVAQ